MNKRHRFLTALHFLAPDIDTSGGAGGGIVVPVVEPVSTSTVTDVNLGDQPAVENSPAVKEQARERNKLKGPQDFGGESPEDSQERMGLAKGRERGPDGRFLPSDQKTAAVEKTKEPVKEAPKSGPPKATPLAEKKPAPAKPVAKPAQTPTAQPTKPADAPAAKIKLAGEERTAEEWEKHFKELADKAKQTSDEALKAIKEPAKPKETPEAITEANNAREQAFIEKTMANYGIDQGAWDKALSTGDFTPIATGLARAEMRSRQFTAQALQAIRDEFAPILENHSRVQGLMEEASFLGAHKDIAEHPEGAATFRKLSSDRQNAFNSIGAKIDAGTASRSERAWFDLYDEQTPEQRNSDVAHYVREELKKTPAVAQTPAQQPAKPTSPPQLSVVEKPLNADRPGGGNSNTRTESAEQRLARETLAASGF